MKRFLIFLPFFLFTLTVSSKSGILPSYKAFVYWILNTDTLYTEGNSLLHESMSPDSTIIVRVRHEDWQNKVTSKSIARLAPWHAVISQRRGIRAILHEGSSNTDAMMPMKLVPALMTNASNVKSLSGMTNMLDMDFQSEVMLENTGEYEVVINDLNRGLVWYLPSKAYLLLNLGNLPQACLLRIASTDPNNPSVKYATVGKAAFTIKLTIAYEDEDCWIYLIDEEEDFENDDEKLNFTRLMGDSESVFRIHYVKRDKDTFQEVLMTEDEVFTIIKNAKNAKSKKNK